MADEKELVYMWKTSVPRFALKQHVPLKHVSQLQRPFNTLDFLKETQRYIANIRHPELAALHFKAKKRLQTSQLPELLSPSRKSRKPAAGIESEEALIVRAKSWEHFSEEMDSKEGAGRYLITRYMPAKQLSPRLATANTEERPTPSYLNGDIDRFMHRFERNSRRSKH